MELTERGSPLQGARKTKPELLLLGHSCSNLACYRRKNQLWLGFPHGFPSIVGFLRVRPSYIVGVRSGESAAWPVRGGRNCVRGLSDRGQDLGPGPQERLAILDSECWHSCLGRYTVALAHNRAMSRQRRPGGWGVVKFWECVGALACTSLLSACAAGQKPSSSPAAPVVSSSASAGTHLSSWLVSSAAKTWLAAAEAHLERYKRFTIRTGEVELRIDVDRRGYVKLAMVTKSSGSPILDQEALAIVARASPLPPPPHDVAGDEIALIALTVHIRF